MKAAEAARVTAAAAAAAEAAAAASAAVATAAAGEAAASDMRAAEEEVGRRAAMKVGRLAAVEVGCLQSADAAFRTDLEDMKAESQDIPYRYGHGNLPYHLPTSHIDIQDDHIDLPYQSPIFISHIDIGSYLVTLHEGGGDAAQGAEQGRRSRCRGCRHRRRAQVAGDWRSALQRGGGGSGLGLGMWRWRRACGGGSGGGGGRSDGGCGGSVGSGGLVADGTGRILLAGGGFGGSRAWQMMPATSSSSF